MDDRLGWRERESTLLARCGIFDLYRSERVSGEGRAGSFYVLRAPEWVNVVPVVSDAAGRERLLMVRQFRQGLQRITVEFPAGLVETGEKPQEAAARELAEETGRRAGRLQPIGLVSANPAFMNNGCTTFCAEALEGGEQRLDELERLEVLEVEPGELAERIGTGEFINSMTVVAFFWYLRYRRRL